MEDKKKEELFSDAAKRGLRPEISGPIALWILSAKAYVRGNKF